VGAGRLYTEDPDLSSLCGLRFSGTRKPLKMLPLSDMMVKIKMWPAYMNMQIIPMLKLILLIYLNLLVLENKSWLAYAC